MARFDPRDHERDRVCGWHGNHFVEIVLTDDANSWIITVLVDGDPFADAYQKIPKEDPIDTLWASLGVNGTFEDLTTRFLQREAA